MALLETIGDPAQIRSLDNAQLEQLCAELREYIITCCAENPGHIGASLGAVEIAVAIHKVFDTPHDKVVWDVGHQAYAHKITVSAVARAVTKARTTLSARAIPPPRSQRRSAWPWPRSSRGRRST